LPSSEGYSYRANMPESCNAALALGQRPDPPSKFCESLLCLSFRALPSVLTYAPVCVLAPMVESTRSNQPFLLRQFLSPPLKAGASCRCSPFSCHHVVRREGGCPLTAALGGFFKTFSNSRTESFRLRFFSGRSRNLSPFDTQKPAGRYPPPHSFTFPSHIFFSVGSVLCPAAPG